MGVGAAIGFLVGVVWVIFGYWAAYHHVRSHNGNELKVLLHGKIKMVIGIKTYIYDLFCLFICTGAGAALGFLFS